MRFNTTLPPPDPVSQQHSDCLQQIIHHKIYQQQGWMSFADFMNLALYHPGMGYYNNNLEKIGSGGDFITAPEISPLFSFALGNHIAGTLSQLEHADCLEFGAGNGQMAVDLLLHLASQDSLPKRYFILEASAYFREKQSKLMHLKLGEIAERVIWLDKLPDTFRGVIIANEVCDAMPVHRVQFDKTQCLELGIISQNGTLRWNTRQIENPDLLTRCEEIHPRLVTFPYQSEIGLQSVAWLSSIAERLEQGAIYLIDYGYEANEYYHPQRHQGTLQCHYQHHVHSDPLVLIGLQDITSHIDFTALAEAAHAAGLQVTGFQRQHDFLLSGDIMQYAPQSLPDSLTEIQQIAALKQLLLPEHMGERFKVLSLAKNIILPRSNKRDLRYRL